MTPSEIKKARQHLGLTQRQLGDLLDTDVTSVRRMEMEKTASTQRDPAPRMIRLITAYLTGYRPNDWPIDCYNDGTTFFAIADGVTLSERFDASSKEELKTIATTKFEDKIWSGCISFYQKPFFESASFFPDQI